MVAPPPPLAASHSRPAPIEAGLLLIYQIDAAVTDEAQRKSAAERVAGVMRLRLDRLELNRATVAAKGDTIEVRLPPMAGERVAQAKDVLARWGRLEFRLVDDGNDYLGRVAAGLATSASAAGVEVRPEIVATAGRASTTHYATANLRPGESAADARRRLEGFTVGVPIPSDRQVSYGEVRDGNNSLVGWRTYLVMRRIELSNEQVARVVAQRDSVEGNWSIELTFTAEGARDMEQLTAQNVRKRLAIMVEDRVESAPLILGAIRGGVARLTMGRAGTEVDEREAKQLAVALLSGPLPVRVVLAVESQIR